MAQPPPRKGAYNKFVLNLHKDQFSKLQAKNQQELDLLDDIRKPSLTDYSLSILLVNVNVYQLINIGLCLEFSTKR